MKKHYREKCTINLITLVGIIMVVLVCMNVGYSLWESKLNISGKVELKYEEQPLEVSVNMISSGKYTSISGLTRDGIIVADFVSDKLEDNNLETVIKINENISQIDVDANIILTFDLKNTSKSGDIYINGNTELIETSGIVENTNLQLEKSTLSSGQNTKVVWSGKINKSNLEKDIYYKYLISYKVDEQMKYFYYTLKLQK